MHFRLGLLAVAGAAVGAMFWLSQPAPAHQAVDVPIVINEQAIVSVREDAVASVVQMVSKAASSSEPVRDPFVGTWTGDCGDLVQCDLKIEMVDKAYTLELKIADWQNADNVVCRLNGSMHISDDRQFLAGKMGSSPLSGAFLRGEGALELHDVPDMDCGKPFALDGIYRILGD